MIRPMFMLTAALLLGTVCLTARSAEKPPKQELSGKIKWVYDYEQARQASRESGKPMFVVFRCER